MYTNAAPFFKEKGIEIFAFSTSEQLGNFADRFREAGISVYHFPLPKQKIKSLTSYRKKVIDFINTNKIQLIHIHRSDVKWLFSLIAKQAGIKAIYTAHNVFRNPKYSWPKAWLTRYSARKLFGLTIHTIGKSVHDNELNYYKTPSVQINNWYNDKKFYPAQSPGERALKRAHLNIPEDAFVLISSGSCTYTKNHHDIIKAMASLPKQNVFLYLHLGCGPTEEEEKKLAADLEVFSNIRFCGNQSCVRDFLLAANVFVMPSGFEGLSIASIEAMACGLPSIIYNVPGLRDVVINGHNGFLIEPGYKKIAEHVELLLNNTALAKQMGDNTIKFVNENFKMQPNVEQIINFYKKQLL